MSPHVFVVISEGSRHGIVIGKNSNRPPNEVQELVYEDAHSDAVDVKCTYTTVSRPAVSGSEACAVILSKPGAFWGCEMGTNQHDVTGAVVSFKEDAVAGLLPQDMLRLALEQSPTAAIAVDSIGSLVSNHAVEAVSGYVLADKTDVFYMEAIGSAWVAQKLPPGVKILPSSHIAADYDKSVDNLEELAKERGWTGEGKLVWHEVFLGTVAGEKQEAVEKAIREAYFSDVSDWSVKQMTQVLRDTENRISRGSADVRPTAASQISVLGGSGPGCHWFTATPDPTLSVFKPFIFTPNARISTLTKISPDSDGQHQLYRQHASAISSGENKVISLLQEMEANCLNEVNSFMLDGTQGGNLAEVDDLLKDCVEAEVKFYR